MPACPICGTAKFRDYNGRTNAVCEGCGSLERTRYLWLFLQQRKALARGKRLLHVAPEKCLTARLSKAIGKGYEPVDFAPDRYTTDDVTVGRFDMCSDLFKLKPGSYDTIMHLHVLEHIPCSIENVLVGTMKALKPGGRLIFGIPMARGVTIENLWPDLTKEERTQTFGQYDHLRRFGAGDFPRFLRRVVEPYAIKAEYRVDPATVGEDVLTAAAVPVAKAKGYTGETLFEVVRAA